MQQNNSRFSKLKIFYLFFVPGVILSSIYIHQDTHTQLQTLEDKKEEALETKKDLEIERDYLKNKIELLSNPDYFKSYAKRKLLYTSEGELLFVFPEDN